MVPPPLRACEKLRLKLSPIMGKAGVRALLTHALTQAAEEVPWVQVLRLNPDGTFSAFNKIEACMPQRKCRAESTVLLAKLLALLTTLIGETLTLRIVHQIWAGLPSENANTGDAKPRLRVQFQPFNSS